MTPADLDATHHAERLTRSATDAGRWLLPVLVTLALAWGWYIHHWPGLLTANEIMRLHFIQAVVDEGRPELDGVIARYGSKPVDRSEYGGHIYMDKAPGASLVALPAYPLLKLVWPDVSHLGVWRLGWAATWLACVLPLLGMLWLLARWLNSWGVSRRSAAMTVVAIGLGSPVFVYATLYFGHALAAACVGAGVFALAQWAPTRPLPRGRGLLAGMALGMGGLTDTPVFVLGGMAVIWAVARQARSRQVTGNLDPAAAVLAGLRETVPVAVGFGLFVLLQLGYNAWVLGHPLRFTYQWKADKQLAAIMDTGFLGFRLPQADALAGLWLGPKRGLLYHAPWLAAAAAGLGVTASDQFVARWRRLDAAALGVLVVLYALFVSGFADWPAGDSAGARHLLPIVPLLGAGLGLVQERPMPRLLRAALAAALAASVILHAPIVATFPYHFAQLHSPVLELSIPLTVQGFFSPSIGRFLGWDEWLSAAMFALLVILPWTLAVRLPSSAPVERRPWLRLGLVLLLLVTWATGVTAAIPPHGRIPEVTRFYAQQMLGPSVWQRREAKAARRNSDPAPQMRRVGNEN